jgi:hypothetical protein
MKEEVIIVRGGSSTWHPRFLGQAKMTLQQAIIPSRESRDVEKENQKILHLCLQSCQRLTKTVKNRGIPALYSFLLKNEKPFKMTSTIHEPVDLLITGYEDIYLMDDECNIIENLDCIFRLLIQYT